MQITLQKLTLTNFMGVRDFVFEPNGRNATVKGVNGVGKTTLFSAFNWLLFGKDAQGKADFAIKTLDAQGHEIHNLDHSVEAVLEIDGNSISLKKVFSEKYTKKRGQPKAEFTGHSTDYFFDGVPIQQKEWQTRISGIIDEEKFKLLTSPTYFNSLHWQKRREILLQVCGDIPDADVIAANNDLKDLTAILSGRSLEDYRKIAIATKQKINKQLTEIPARIDELTRSLNGVSAYDQVSIAAEIERLEQEIRAIKDDATRANLRKQKAELEAELAKLRADLFAEKQGKTQAIRVAVHNLESSVRSLQNKRAEATEAMARHQQNENRLNSRILILREDFSKISGQAFKSDTVCPACGQDLPADQVDAAIKAHNQKKSEKLTDINEHGRSLKDQLKAEQDAYTARALEVQDLDEEIKANEERLAEAQADLSGIEETAGQAKLQEIKAVEDMLRMVGEDIKANADTQDIAPLKSELEKEQAKLAEIEAAKKTRERIEELSHSEKELAAEYEQIERQLYLMDQFVETKVLLLDSKINSKFELARFKMFSDQINGGIQETCTTLYNGVPWGYGLNTGAEINVGLDIIKTLSNHYNIKAPVFIDHAESVVDILETGAQTIKLAVDEGCPQMEVSYER
jgi:DNA repair exonuclease SbcCD ATPase subunit